MAGIRGGHIKALATQEIEDSLDDPLATVEIRALGVQELTRRNLLGIKESLDKQNESFKKADEKNTRFTHVLIFFAVVQIIVAVFQLATPYFVSGDSVEQWKGLGIVSVLAILLLYISKDYFRGDKEKGEG